MVFVWLNNRSIKRAPTTDCLGRDSTSLPAQLVGNWFLFFIAIGPVGSPTQDNVKLGNILKTFPGGGAPDSTFAGEH
ncbi:hypothetical protein J6590_092221 [Homalodisca vitripennis]|nr:hypothetical protein J6590_092221 [Homalodisca vitripennis]